MKCSLYEGQHEGKKKIHPSPQGSLDSTRQKQELNLGSCELSLFLKYTNITGKAKPSVFSCFLMHVSMQHAKAGKIYREWSCSIWSQFLLFNLLYQNPKPEFVLSSLGIKWLYTASHNLIDLSIKSLPWEMFSPKK